MPIDFPPLSAEMQAHSQAVLDHIGGEIQKAGGLISFARFMELALYAPGLGYYSSGSHKLGKSGDFITAPEISPLFAKSVARQFKQILNQLPQGDILELGAGTGNFAKDVLLELEQTQNLPAHYYILETSADLRQRQETLLKSACPQLYSRISWLDRLPEPFKGVIFANEVLDALPVHCFRVENKAVLERCVTLKEGQLAWALSSPISPELNTKVSALIQEYGLGNGYESEINLLLAPWITSLAQTLKQGALIFFDYGYGHREYYHPERTTGTLRCYFQHRLHDNPFLYPGLQDLTANVDFTAVAESAVANGLSLAGYTAQSSFLMASGISDLTQGENSPIEQYQQSQALKLLMLPSEMGSLVKAIGFTKSLDIELEGFGLFDKQREL